MALSREKSCLKRALDRKGPRSSIMLNDEVPEVRGLKKASSKQFQETMTSCGIYLKGPRSLQAVEHAICVQMKNLDSAVHPTGSPEIRVSTALNAPVLYRETGTLAHYTEDVHNKKKAQI